MNALYTNKSIYKNILDLSAKNPALPYIFQSVIDGKKDTTYLAEVGELSYDQKLKHSLKLLSLIEKSIETISDLDKPDTADIEAYLVQNSLCSFMNVLMSIFTVKISEDLMQLRQVLDLGFYLATESPNISEVKLGIMLLGLDENDITLQIIKTLGLHSEFTLYAIEAMRKFERHHNIVFYLFKNTTGYGKIAALYSLEPFTPQMNQAVIQSAAVFNKISPSGILLCLIKSNPLAYLSEIPVNQQRFTEISTIMAYAFDKTDFRSYYASVPLAKLYFGSARIFAKNLIDFIAISNIARSLSSEWPGSKDDIAPLNGWTPEFTRECHAVCAEIMAQDKWKYVILNEFSGAAYSTSQLISALTAINTRLSFASFYPLLDKNMFDIKILKYLLVDCNGYYIDDVREYLLEYAPMEEMMSGPTSATEKSLSLDLLPDIWLEYLLRYMYIYDIYEERLAIDCLSARLIEVRREAANILRKNQAEWSAHVVFAIREALDCECEQLIITKLRALLGLSESPDKLRQYIKNDNRPVIIKDNDIVIFECVLENSKRYDLQYFTSELGTGVILYFVTEKLDGFLKNEIVVVTEDGYVVGTLPNSVKFTVSQLTIRNKRTYAVIKESDIENSRLMVQVVLGNEDWQAGNWGTNDWDDNDNKPTLFILKP